VEAVTHLDTHVVVWLYAGEVERFPDAARAALERDTLAVSPAVADRALREHLSTAIWDL
jgi:PIN domain nuclease of toxin-antitoxin system